MNREPFDDIGPKVELKIDILLNWLSPRRKQIWDTLTLVAVSIGSWYLTISVQPAAPNFPLHYSDDSLAVGIIDNAVFNTGLRWFALGIFMQFLSLWRLELWELAKIILLAIGKGLGTCIASIVPIVRRLKTKKD